MMPLHAASMAAASAAAATATSARGPAEWLGRRAIAGAICRAEHRELNRVLLPRALRAGNLLRLIQHTLLKVRLAIFANVFVNGHSWTSINFHDPIIAARAVKPRNAKSEGPDRVRTFRS